MVCYVILINIERRYKINNVLDEKREIFIENEDLKFSMYKRITLILLIIGIIINIVLFFYVDYQSIDCILTFLLLFIMLVCSFANIYSGYIMKKENTFKFNRGVMMTGYYVAGLIYSLLIPVIITTSTGIFKILFIFLIIYIHFLIYYPVVKTSYYFSRQIKENRAITFDRYFKRVTIINMVIIIIDVILMLITYCS